MAHRTVRCTPDSPVRQPRHQSRWILTVGALSSGPASMSVGALDMNCRVSGAPAWACLTSTRAARAFNASQVAVGAEIAVAPLLHRTVRWHTGQSGAPDQRCLQLSLAPLFEPNTWSFYWLSVNLLHLYNLYTRANWLVHLFVLGNSTTKIN
jgi:hypothetical protein